MIINKKWSMPNSETFSIKPIRELIDKYREEGMVIVDPFARNSDIGTITNDLDPDTRAMYHKDATDFLRGLSDNIADMVLYDPPYSSRQVSESYKKLGGAVNMQTTQSSYWAMQKKEIARITKNGGVVITCAWNSGGIGAGLGFEQQEILLVAHGGWHNDTIVTVEKKNQGLLTKEGIVVQFLPQTKDLWVSLNQFYEQIDLERYPRPVEVEGEDKH